MSGTKHDQEKPAIALIPHEAMTGIGRAMTYGAKKYDAHNWRGGFKWLRLASAANRHLWAWIGGQDNDDESGLNHLYHTGACIMMLIGHVDSNLGEDDRWKP